jgi:hypothetical protein
VVRRSGKRTCNGVDEADLRGFVLAPVRVRPLARSRLASADLFGQGDDDARGAAEVAQQEHALTRTTSSPLTWPRVPDRIGIP